jgi:GAF domain-containing protein
MLGPGMGVAHVFLRPSSRRSLGIDTYACHPLIVDGRLLGTLSFGFRTLSSFDPDTIELLKTFCSMVANALARKQTEEVLQRPAQLVQKLFERIP